MKTSNDAKLNSDYFLKWNLKSTSNKKENLAY